TTDAFIEGTCNMTPSRTRSLLLVTVVASALGACIKHGTSPGELPAVAPAAAAPVPAHAPAAQSGYGTAKYGEVPAAPVLGEGGLRAFTLQGDPAKIAISYVP